MKNKNISKITELPNVDFEELKNSISEDTLENFIDNAIAKQVSNLFNSTKYIYQNPKEWDYDKSGSVVNTYETFNTLNYNTLSDFFEEYSGGSKPTFLSGCGLSFLTYEEEVEDIINQEFWILPKKVLSGVLNIGIDDDLMYDFYDEYDNEIHDDFIFPLEYILHDLLQKKLKKPLISIISNLKQKGLLNNQNNFTTNLDFQI